MQKDSQRKATRNNGYYMILGAVLFIGLVGLAFMSAPLVSNNLMQVAGKAQFDRQAANTALVAESVTRLADNAHAGQRIQTVRWLGTQYSLDPQGVLTSLSSTLSNDDEPAVRAAAVNALAQAAITVRDSEDAASKFRDVDARVTTLLKDRYTRETNVSVKRCILSAMGELSHSSGNAVIEDALKDTDPSIREEAITTKSKREQRSRLSRMG